MVNLSISLPRTGPTWSVRPKIYLPREVDVVELPTRCGGQIYRSAD